MFSHRCGPKLPPRPRTSLRGYAAHRSIRRVAKARSAPAARSPTAAATACSATPSGRMQYRRCVPCAFYCPRDDVKHVAGRNGTHLAGEKREFRAAPVRVRGLCTATLHSLPRRVPTRAGCCWHSAGRQQRGVRGREVVAPVPRVISHASHGTRAAGSWVRSRGLAHSRGLLATAALTAGRNRCGGSGIGSMSDASMNRPCSSTLPLLLVITHHRPFSCAAVNSSTASVCKRPTHHAR